MLSEDFDKKIKDAADHHHPAYDENAWKGMEKLLNKHLPEKDDRKRRGIFFLLFFFLLLAGGTALVFINKPGTQYKDINKSTASKPGEQLATTKSVTKETSEETTATRLAENKGPQPSGVDDITGDKELVNDPPLTDGAQAGLSKQNELVFSSGGGGIVKKSSENRKPAAGNGSPTRRKETGDRITRDIQNERMPVQPDAEKQAPASITNDVSTAQPDAATVTINSQPQTTAPSSAITKNTLATDSSEKKPAANEDRVTNNTDEKKGSVKKEKGVPKQSSFFVSLSTAADVSYTSGDRLGKLKAIAGAGIGYTFKERFTIRAGFYSGRKIYTASPDQYHGPDWLYLYYPNLQKVDADCKVNEIPVSLSYNFGKRKMHSWFVSGGVSTLLMKEEKYNYFYKYIPSGPTLSHSYTIQNENKHFFSILTLSAGYQHKIGKRFSFIAEPYLKLPLKGIGGGKVMLNSTGVLLSITATPFNSGNKSKSGKK